MFEGEIYELTLKNMMVYFKVQFIQMFCNDLVVVPIVMMPCSGTKKQFKFQSASGRNV